MGRMLLIGAVIGILVVAALLLWTRSLKAEQLRSYDQDYRSTVQQQ